MRLMLVVATPLNLPTSSHIPTQLFSSPSIDHIPLSPHFSTPPPTLIDPAIASSGSHHDTTAHVRKVG